jgi:hypothetical protein
MVGAAHAQIKVLSNGKVGITDATNPQAALDLGTAKYAAGAPLFLMYNNDQTSPLGGIKMGFYADNFGVGLNLNLVFPEDAGVNKGLFTICGKPTSGTALNQYFSIAGMTGNIGIGAAPSATSGVKLVVGGNSVFGGTMSWTNWESVILDWTNSWSAPVIYPSVNEQMDLGKPANKINTLYAYQTFVDAGYYKTSDRRLKKNITNITSTFSQLKKLQGVTYLLKGDSQKTTQPKNVLASASTKQYGLIAQDVQKVFPELVKQADSSSYLAVDYMGLIPVIIEAMKEQSGTIDSLQLKIATLSSQVAALQSCCKSNSKTKDYVESDAETVSPASTSTTTTAATPAMVLYQNAPNPFKSSTTIKMELPQTVGSAMICIYDLTGRQLKCLPVGGRGITTVEVYGSELTAGLYHYALIADGVLIDTKTMVLTN